LVLNHKLKKKNKIFVIFMDAKAKNITIIAAFGIIAVVLTTGFLTNWFGLYTPESNKIIIVGSTDFSDLSSDLIEEYLKLESDAEIEFQQSTNVVSAIGSNAATLGMTVTTLTTSDYNTYSDINQFQFCNTSAGDPVYLLFNGYPTQATYKFVQFIMGVVGRGLIYANGFKNITLYSGSDTIVTIRGSTTVFPIMSAAAEIFMMFHPEVSIAVSGTGSTDGKNAINGTSPNYIPLVTMGMSSSTLSSSYPNVVNTTVAMDAICVITHPSMTAVTGLTMTDVAKIFNGTYTNWNQVGGPDHAINVYVRESGSGTRDSFNHFTGVSTYVGTATALASNGAVHDSVEADQYAIGYVGMGYVDSAVKAVSINGIAPTPATALDKTYAMSREIFILERIDSYALTGSGLELKNMILGTHLGSWIVEYTGYVALA
jgi:phosphate transport system substrate-binding protein